MNHWTCIEFNNNFICHLEGYVHKTTEKSADERQNLFVDIFV